MKKEYDFTKSSPNPYRDKLEKKQITISLNLDTIKYFKTMAKKEGIPYQTLINLFLNKCANDELKLSVK